jgi:protein-ribulosamine 3-kinase
MAATMPDFGPVAAAIAAARGEAFRVENICSVGGGSIHGAVCLEGANQRYFVKFNERTAEAMFAAEADGLAALADAAAIRVPRVIVSDCSEEYAFLVLEFLDLQPLDRSTGGSCGRALADLHRDVSDRFGWRRDNFIGATPQSNRPQHEHWSHFFATHRLRPQLALAAKRGMERKWLNLGEGIAENLGGFFIDYQPAPSLLHGDLWSGNVGALADGTPVLFDPAVYHGDREADLAMAELFGGFPESFYAAYRQAWPLDHGYETRKPLYNLYHVLNHFNLFGASYLGQAQCMIERLRTELRG